MLSKSIPNATQDDIRTYGGKIGETYSRLENKAKTFPRPMTPDELYIMALTRILAHMQREIKELHDTLQSRHGIR